MEPVRFLDVVSVLTIHEHQIAEHGGEAGIRDLGLIESAVAQPKATFGGEYLNGDLFQMAAALAFGLVQNHGFLDGNKRVAYASTLAFLELNGHDSDCVDPDVFEPLILRAASGEAGKDEIAKFLSEAFE